MSHTALRIFSWSLLQMTTRDFPRTWSSKSRKSECRLAELSAQKAPARKSRSWYRENAAIGFLSCFRMRISHQGLSCVQSAIMVMFASGLAANTLRSSSALLSSKSSINSICHRPVLSEGVSENCLCLTNRAVCDSCKDEKLLGFVT